MPKNKINHRDLERILISSNGYISGAEIARKLGVTRAAVQKAVSRLKKTGYVIETCPSKGYQINCYPDLCVSEIERILSRSQNHTRHKIYYFETIPSTNLAAVELAEKGLSEETIVIADEQTEGRGRLGRSWISPASVNLYMSIALKPDMPPSDLTCLTLLASVACAVAIKNICGIAVNIKWPNDLLSRSRKIGGILAEIRADMDKIHYAVIGIGININISEDEMPSEIKQTASSILIETGRKYSRNLIAASIIEEFDKWLGSLLLHGRKPIIEKWRELCSTIGKPVKISLGGKIFEGIAADIDDEGLLILKTSDGAYRKFSSGDVTISGAER